MFKILIKIVNRVYDSLRILFFRNDFYLYPKSKYNFLQYHFSQEGEDLVFWKIINAKKEGFYIDIGAHHPQRLSNTYFLYLKGWKGLNIDPIPGMARIFNQIRPDDINLECGISSTNSTLEYHRFEEPLLNTFSDKIKTEYLKMGFKFTDTLLIETKPLNQILEEFLPIGQEIDLLSVDVEGLDLDVLKSNDWKKFNPNYIIVEDLNLKSLEDVINSELNKYLSGLNYVPVSKLHNSIIFKKENSHA